MLEVFFINLASLVTLYTGQPIMVVVVSTALVQFGTQRVASEGALYMIPALITPLVFRTKQQPSPANPNLYAALVINLLLGLGFVPEIVALFLQELDLLISDQFADIRYRRWGFLVVCWVTRWIWFPEVTFYVTMSMVAYTGVLLALKNKL